MNGARSSESFTSRWHLSTHLLGYLLILGFGLRRVDELAGAFSISLALVLLGVFTALFAAERWLVGRRGLPCWLYFLAQMLIVQILGFFEVYIDTWAVLYLVIGMQAAVTCPRRSALVFWGLFIGFILGSFFFQFGVLSGLGRGLAYIVIGVFFISFDNQYARREAAQAESQVLLEELQAAHHKLQEQAAQAEQLAALHERSRITQEIYDAVGQKIFAIQLLAETAGVLREKDPPRLESQLALLQEQTQAALGQMRGLISRWRSDRTPPPQDGDAPAPAATSDG